MSKPTKYVLVATDNRWGLTTTEFKSSRGILNALIELEFDEAQSPFEGHVDALNEVNRHIKEYADRYLRESLDCLANKRPKDSSQ